MSCMYYRVDPVALPPMSFGFRKVDEVELQEIVQRMTRPTYSSLLQKDIEQRFAHNYRYLRENNSRRRTPSACVRRRPATTIPIGGGTNSRQISERDIQRIFRRMQTQTQSSIYRTVYAEKPKLMRDPFSREGRVHFRDQMEKAKAFERLRRPTTASRAKDVSDCHTCSDQQLRSKFDLDVPLDYDYATEETSVRPEELEFIVERVRATTFSREDTKRCERLPPTLDEVKIREKIPLVSGLARSKNVDEIVQRLHPSRRHGYKPEATEVTVE
ncbi:uncharacterized protein LOC121387701 [Gigantopelta aegis]|uniref:uncharacterized protein LOC121387701 n=1 Tax=Gigantopelta aegis TaxID=1735272 RepID=UPI001B8891DE|nr:uncharacterized protein LOC121387701 [Gigantopelta aegis]XP_041374829.1 uncharacterized protein LOC121387701 [Gigantopelta aegis]